MSPMKIESELQKFLIKEAKKLDILAEKIVSNSGRGFPDVMLIKNGRIVFVELKSPSKTGRLHPLQERKIAQLRDHGAEVYIVYTPTQCLNLLKSF